MAATINTVPVPTTMSTRGVYKFTRRDVSNMNGKGTTQATGPQTVQWQFGSMTAAELEWWYTTLLAGALSVSLTQARLWDDLMVETEFTGGVLYRPTWEKWSAGAFRNVVITFSHLTPII